MTKLARRLRSLAKYFAPAMISLFPGSSFRYLRCLFWRTVGYDIDLQANIMAGARLRYGQIAVGAKTYIGEETLVTGGSITIGESCDIAPRCIIHAGTHDLGSKNRRAGKVRSGTIVIGDGTWVGVGTTVLAGAHIGCSSIIAAGSVVVAGDYPKNVLLAGSPAVIKKRLT